MFNQVYENRRVLLTGDTGFKGSWMRYWLEKMGAEVYGYSLLPQTNPNHFELLGFERTQREDILDLVCLSRAFKEFQPEIVFHLAAQPLVRLSYEKPVETFATNIQGTVHLLEACRKTSSVRSIVVITSDKCYENREQIWGYREQDPMGGYDPYSASKGCTELVVSSFRRSFFSDDKTALLASARAGNVIGGGDWSKDRLVPDIMKAAAKGETVEIRSPESTRPWQHVLEPISGYLFLGQLLYEGKRDFAQAWNFGLLHGNVLTVLDSVKSLKKSWSKIDYIVNSPNNVPHEAKNLTLDCTKSNLLLKWVGVWNAIKAFEKTASWYREYYEKGYLSTEQDLKDYLKDAESIGMTWAK